MRGRVRESCLRQWAQQVERGSGGVGRLSGTDRSAATLEGRFAGTLLWSAEYCGPPTLSTVHVYCPRKCEVSGACALSVRVDRSPDDLASSVHSSSVVSQR